MPNNASCGAARDGLTIHKIIWPDTRNTVDNFKRIDANTPIDKYDWLRIVAEWAGKPVGYDIHFRALDNDVTHQYQISFSTHPNYRR
jgi:hypothetical protein